MKILVLFGAWIALTLAKPNGYYHQEYNYKTSASSYRNNELQHRNDNEGHYSKQGDLDGRIKPKVNSHTQHSEYINPNLQNSQYQYNHNNNGYNIRDLSHQYNNGGSLDLDSMNYGYHQSSNQLLNANTYGIQSNLRQIAQNVQNDLSNDIQLNILDYKRRSSYDSHLNRIQLDNDLRNFEDELRRNLTNKINEAIRQQYGMQIVRDSQSYSISNGHMQSVANFHNQELDELKRQMERNLLQQLKNTMHVQFRNYYNESNSHIETWSHPSSTLYPSLPIYPTNPTYVVHPTSSRYIVNPQPNSEALTTIALTSQQHLNRMLDEKLNDIRHQYMQPNIQTNTDTLEYLLTNLQYELRENITKEFRNEIEHKYGIGAYETSTLYNQQNLNELKRQIEDNLIKKLNNDFLRYKQDYINLRLTHTTPKYDIYTIRPTSYIVTQQFDINAIQRHLQEELTRQLQHALIKYRNNLQYNNNRKGGSYQSYGQQNQQIILQQLTEELNRNLTEQLNRELSQYQYNQYASGYNANALANLRSQLQNDLNRQLQQGIQSYSSYSSWSSSSSSSAGGLQRLTRGYDPINPSSHGQYQANGQYGSVVGEDCMMGDDAGASRTKRSIPYSHYGGATYGPHGGHFGLEENYDTQQQIQTQHYHRRAASYHSHNNFRGQQQLDDLDMTQRIEDALNQKQTQQLFVDDGLKKTNPFVNDDHVALVQQQQVDHVHAEDFMLPHQRSHADLAQQQQLQNRRFGPFDIGQQEDDADLTQQVQQVDQNEFVTPKFYRYTDLVQQQQQQIRKNNGFSNLEIGQQEDDEDLTQQVQHVQQAEFIAPKPNHRHSDLTQQQQDHGIGKLVIGQQQDNEDLTQVQQVEQISILKPKPKPNIYSTNQQIVKPLNDYGSFQLGQQEEDDEDVVQKLQKVEQNDFVKPKPNIYSSNQQIVKPLNDYGSFQLGQEEEDDEDVVQKLQKVEQNDFFKPKPNNQLRLTQNTNGKLELGQVNDNDDSVQQVQQVEQNDFLKPENSNRRTYLVQQVENSQDNLEFGQRDDNVHFIVQSQHGEIHDFSKPKQNDRSYLDQQTQDNGFGQLQFGQQEDDEDLPQQTQQNNLFKPQSNRNSHFSHQMQETQDSHHRYENHDLIQQQEEDDDSIKPKPSSHRFLSQQHVEEDNLNQQIEENLHQQVELVQKDTNGKIQQNINNFHQQQVSDFIPNQQTQQQEDIYNFRSNPNGLIQQVEDDHFLKNIHNEDFQSQDVEDGQLTQQTENAFSFDVKHHHHQQQQADDQTLIKIKSTSDEVEQPIEPEDLRVVPLQQGLNQVQTPLVESTNFRAYNPDLENAYKRSQELIDKQVALSTQQIENTYSRTNYGRQSNSYNWRESLFSTTEKPEMETIRTVLYSQFEPAINVKSQHIEPKQQVEEFVSQPHDVKTIHGVYHSVDNVDELITTTEQPGFWKRLGNKIKSSAISVKERMG